MSEENGKVCCSCGHNIRSKEKTGIECHCDIDGHYIGYIECMSVWCRHWKRDRKWDKEKTMGRLIDADELIKRFRSGKADTEEEKTMCSTVRRMIKEQPTAYDVDKVVKELDEWTFNANVDIGDGTMMNSNFIVRDNAIEIVKAGGIDGDTNI